MRWTMGSKVAKSRTPRTKEHDEPGALETLVRQLVAEARHVAPAPTIRRRKVARREEGSGEVLFDYEVDGVRCVLARARSSSADAPSPEPSRTRSGPHDREGLSEQDHRVCPGYQCVDCLHASSTDLCQTRSNLAHGHGHDDVQERKTRKDRSLIVRPAP